MLPEARMKFVCFCAENPRNSMKLKQKTVKVKVKKKRQQKIENR